MKKSLTKIFSLFICGMLFFSYSDVMAQGCANGTSFSSGPTVTGTTNPDGSYDCTQPLTVDFCYDITDFTETGTNWIHGIAPTDDPNWTITGNSITVGDGDTNWIFDSAQPNPGYYYDSDGDGASSDNFGDGSETAGWTACFTATFTGTCPASGSPAPYDPAMNVSGDGTTGSWNNSDCDPVPETSGNPPITFQQPPAAPTCFLSATDVAIGACDDNGTEDPTDDFFTITATLDYTDGDGDVVIAGITATPSPAPANATAQAFTVTLPADGAGYNLVVTVGSNADGACEADFGAQTAPAACSFSCGIVITQLGGAGYNECQNIQDDFDANGGGGFPGYTAAQDPCTFCAATSVGVDYGVQPIGCDPVTNSTTTEYWSYGGSAAVDPCGGVFDGSAPDNNDGMIATGTYWDHPDADGCSTVYFNTAFDIVVADPGCPCDGVCVQSEPVTVALSNPDLAGYGLEAIPGDCATAPSANIIPQDASGAQLVHPITGELIVCVVDVQADITVAPLCGESGNATLDITIYDTELDALGLLPSCPTFEDILIPYNCACCDQVYDYTPSEVCSGTAPTFVVDAATCDPGSLDQFGLELDLDFYIYAPGGVPAEAPVGYDPLAAAGGVDNSFPMTNTDLVNDGGLGGTWNGTICADFPGANPLQNLTCDPITVTYFVMPWSRAFDTDGDGSFGEYNSVEDSACEWVRYEVTVYPDAPQIFGAAGDCDVAPFIEIYAADGVTLCDGPIEGPLPDENICSITETVWDVNEVFGVAGSGCEFAIQFPISSFCENTDCCPTEVDSQFESVDVCDLGSPDPAVVDTMEAAILASLVPDPAVTGIPVTIGWVDVASNTYLSTDGIAFSSPDEFAFTNPTCDPGSLSFIPVVICQNPSTGEFTELQAGLLSVTIYPVPVIAFPDLTPIPSDCDPDVTTPTDNCVTAITTNCPNAIIEYDTDGDGFTDSIFPPDPTPDGGVQTYGAIAYIEGAPLDQGCFGAQLYDTECVCDLLDVTISPVQGMNGGILPFWYNAVDVDICGGSGSYTFDWERSGYVRVDQSNDFFNPDSPEFQIHYADEADWALTITDEYGCDMIVTNDNAWEGGSNGVINGGPILDVCDFELTGSTGVNNEDGTLTICVEGGTAGYTLELYQGSQVSVGTYVNSMNIDNDGGVLAGAANAGDCLDCITFTDLETSHYTVLITDANGETTEDHYWLPLDRNGGRLKSDLSNSNIMVNAYPNPFAEETMIEFATDIDTDVTVNIIDVAGRIVDTAFAGFVEAGQVQFVNFDANNMANGIYICQITTENGNTATYKLVVSK